MLEHRLQILLDQKRYDKLTREAERRGISIAAVIREAIDHLATDAGRRKAAVAAILAADAMEVPANSADLRRELDAAHVRLPA